MQCEHIHRNGNRCRSYATGSQVLCHSHAPTIRGVTYSEAEVRETVRREFALMREKRQELMKLLRVLPAILAIKPKPDPAILNAYTTDVRDATKALQFHVWLCQIILSAEKLKHQMQKAANGSAQRTTARS